MAERTGKNNTDTTVAVSPIIGKDGGDNAGLAGESSAERLRGSLRAARERTASTLSRAGAGLGMGGRKAASASGRFYTERLHPQLGRAGVWLARRLNPASLVRDYRRVLLLVHRFGPDRSLERLFFVRTAGRVPLSIVRMPHQLRRSGHDYRPTPRKVFEWAMEAVPEPVDHFGFVDYGAGRGRVLLMASHHPFEKITGVEVGEELYNDCLLNIAQYPRYLMKCRDIDCEHISAMRLDVPDEETVFYFNNPFNRAMFERVLGQIVRAYKQEPCRHYLICVDIPESELIQDTGIFEPVAIPWRRRLKIALFSPYSIGLYRTVH